MDTDNDQKSRGTPYREMSGLQKLRFILKLSVCILTFGIVFPNVMSE
jgi:hypothetical protein